MTLPLLLAALPLLTLLSAPPDLPAVRAEQVRLSARRLADIDAAVNAAIERKELPGAVVLVGRHGKIAFLRAYGHRALAPEAEVMTVDTVFDLASLTKPVATAMCVMSLVERGKLRLSDRVVVHLPEFGAGGGARGEVTIEDLLVHRAGLPPDDPIELYAGTAAEIFERKHRLPLAFAPRERFVYSDAGYEVLAELIRKTSGAPLDACAQERVFAPLGMLETEFRPIGRGGALPVSRIAPTEITDGRFLRGEVHDPRAYALGGVAGHAGLFSTARDLARFASAILAGGGGVLSPATVAAMTRPRPYGDSDLRGLGWDIATGYSSSRGDLFPVGSFGHTGWTGTSMWLDPITDTFVILLSNRNHPDGKGNVIPLRGKVATIAAAAVEDVSAETLRQASARVLALAGPAHAATPAAAAPGKPAEGPDAKGANGRNGVETGLDVLVDHGFSEIAGLTIGLLTNQTGVARDGRSAAEVLSSPAARKAGVKLIRLFSPEHGIRGTADGAVPDTRDERTGLPIRSLYETESSAQGRGPRPEDLADLDAVVVDLQDAGVRFYTYVSTLGGVLEECARAGKRVIVLDRPDPIRADRMEGPLADSDRLSFTAFHPIPVRTGMTLGELARLFDAEKKLGASLTVVKMSGYRRDLWYDETGLAWVNPSPNLRSVTGAALYPGVALLEYTNVSVGRGTDAPFEIVAAPWIDGTALARTLNATGLAAVRFTPVAITPAAPPYKGEACRGVRITLVDRNALDAVGLGLTIAAALRDLYPKAWDRSRLGDLLANKAALARFERGETAREIGLGWAAELMEFQARRSKYLLY